MAAIRPHLRSLRLGAVLALVASLAAGNAARAAGDFAYEQVIDGFQHATDFAFAPDGRIFVAELRGSVRVVKNGVVVPAPFVTVPVNAVGERGLLGLALDPGFASNGYVYLYYTAETDPADPEGPKTNRLVRVTAAGDRALPGSELVLLGSVLGTPTLPSCEDHPAGSDCLPVDTLSHVGGGLRFAPDGNLFVSTGDGVLTNVDPFLALRAQDLDSLAGKLLRIRPQDGAAPSDNPFFTGDATANRSKVYAYGFRHPFRFGVHPVNGLPIVGDVGYLAYEELDVVPPGGRNFGWPCFESTTFSPLVGSDPVCQALPAASVTFPIHAYPNVEGAAVIGGVFDPGLRYPPEFSGVFFFGDYVASEVRTLKLGAGPPEIGVAATLPTPVDFEVGPDDYVYVLSIGAGAVYRLVHTSVNVPPLAKASVTPLAGLAPLAVQFSTADTLDSNGDALTYEWNFGDGATSSQPNPTHVYAANGTYAPTVTVRDPSNATDVVALQMLVGREPPRLAITSPANGSIYATGERLALRASAVDPDDGPLPGASVSWVVFLTHCVLETPMSGDCHSHPLVEQAGTGLDFIAPNHGTGDPAEFYFLDVTATATDSDGIAATASIRVGPDLDADRCMDFFAPFATATAPYQGGSDGFSESTPASLAVANHTWNPTGVFTNTAIAAAPPSGASESAAFAALFGPLAIAEEGDYAITFDAFVGGIVGVVPGAAGVDAQLLGQGTLLRASDDTEVASAPLFAHRIQANASGPTQRFPIGQPNARLPIVARLAPGDYEWRFLTTALAVATSDAASTTVAASASSVTLREARVCKQRLPDDAVAR